jgi:hypothetical protein
MPVIAIALFGITLIAGCVAERPRVLDERIIDTGIKTQVEQAVLIPSSYTPAQMRALLESQYREVVGRGGYKFHQRPTNVHIYLFEQEIDTLHRYRNWRAMLGQDFGLAPEFLRRDGSVIERLPSSGEPGR